ncbi:MAG: hypothetical protein U1F67_23320 [Rubrivivax sp.]
MPRQQRGALLGFHEQHALGQRVGQHGRRREHGRRDRRALPARHAAVETLVLRRRVR